MNEQDVLYKKTLVITLNKYIKAVRKGTRLNFSHFIIFIIYLALSYLFCIAHWKDSVSRPAPQAYFMISILTILLIILIPVSIKYTRKMLQLIAKCGSDKIVLDETAIEIPAYILMQQTMRDMIDTGHYIVRINWDDIIRFDIMRQRKYSPKCYAIHLKNPIATPNGDYTTRGRIDIRCMFTKKEEEDFLSFAQKSLSIPIQKEGVWSFSPYY